jgi:SAM-dependent methyltransferase
MFGWPTHVSICKQCGLVYLSPRWTKERYNQYYTQEYEGDYREDRESAKETEQRKIKQAWERIEPHLPENPKAALDIGCGLGWALGFVAEQIEGIRISGIESSQESITHLQEVIGAEFIGADVDTDWHLNHQDSFDLIIMRMVAEHLLDPVTAFKKVRSTLTDGGILYLAVPDMLDPSGPLKDFWYRVVHTYYYSKPTLIRTLSISGLEPVVISSQGSELWAVVKRRDTFEDPHLPSIYQGQLKALRRYKFKRGLRGFLRLFSPRKLMAKTPNWIKNLIPESLKERFRKLVYRH